MGQVFELIDRMSERRTAIKLANIQSRPPATGFSSREQLLAFCLLVMAAAIVGLAPVIITGIMGKVMPDALIANSDKTVTGLIGVLGTITGLIFRRSQADDAVTNNTTKFVDAIRSAQGTGPDTGPNGPVGAAAGEVAEAADEKATQIQGKTS